MATVKRNQDLSSGQWVRRFLILFLPLAAILAVSFYYGFDVQQSSLMLLNERSLVELGLRTDESVEDDEPLPSNEPLNVVLFYADDWTMKVLGKLNPDVKTPNIDRMADNGMLFSNNCVTTSVCWMSRATLVTGVYASIHQEVSPPSENMFTTNPWNQTLFPLMKQHGYYTGLVGKWHAPQPTQHMAAAFDYRNFYFGSHYMTRKGVTRHVTELNEEDSINFLRKRPKDKKFFLKVSFFATHAEDGSAVSYKAQPSSMENLYQDVTIPSPKTATDAHWKDLPPFFGERNEGRKRWKNRFEPDFYQENIKNLYRMATEVDTAVGNIIKELKDQGVYNNTLLVFTTDNGNLHGEHGLAEKWFPFEEAIRVPLVIQDPRMPKHKRGTVNDDWTLSVDLAPTILGAAGIEPSSFMQGRDISHLYLDKNPSWRQDFFYEYNRGHPVTGEGHIGKDWIDASFALVTKEWKYIYWPQQDYEQLFHRSIDPYDEWDTLKKDMVKTTDDVYVKMKTRYTFLKDWVQSGNRV
jgi:arylsulfatase